MNKNMELKHYKEKVQTILEEHEQSRNNDGTMIAYFVKKYCKSLIVTDPDGNEMIPLKHLKHLPPLESLTRARRIIQNDIQILRPTDPEVLKGRRMKELNYRYAEVREARV